MSEKCPCCQFPTLDERGIYDICFICEWEDDGQDDYNANEILGGPNSDYSLAEARENFKKYLSYRRRDENNLKQEDEILAMKKEVINLYNILDKEKQVDKQEHIKAVIDNFKLKIINF